MPPDYGFFTFRVREDPAARCDQLGRLLKAAYRRSERVDVVVYPELALSAEEFEEVKKVCEENKIALVAGVAEDVGEPCRSRNTVKVHFPTDSYPILESQDEHHRWCLDSNQIINYGLGGFLSPARRWWERTRLGDRQLTFFCLNDWLTFCVLICENLARQEPVAELLRAVGPNLVIALLMDGPQSPHRWPAHYATVLADDPGSSVLTLTSLGMADLCRPPGKPPSRSIGLWKDVRGGEPRQLDLGPGAAGLLLTLVPHWEEEWTADGRSDGRTAAYSALAAVHTLYGGASRAEMLESPLSP